MSAILFGLVALGYIWLAVQANNKFERQLRGARLGKSAFKRPLWLFKDAVFILMVGPPLRSSPLFVSTNKLHICQPPRPSHVLAKNRGHFVILKTVSQKHLPTAVAIRIVI